MNILAKCNAIARPPMIPKKIKNFAPPALTEHQEAYN